MRTTILFALLSAAAVLFASAPPASATHSFCDNTADDERIVDLFGQQFIARDRDFDGGGDAVCVFQYAVIADDNPPPAGTTGTFYVIRVCTGLTCPVTVPSTGAAVGTRNGGPLCIGTTCPQVYLVAHAAGVPVTLLAP